MQFAYSVFISSYWTLVRLRSLSPATESLMLRVKVNLLHCTIYRCKWGKWVPKSIIQFAIVFVGKMVFWDMPCPGHCLRKTPGDSDRKWDTKANLLFWAFFSVSDLISLLGLFEKKYEFSMRSRFPFLSGGN